MNFVHKAESAHAVGTVFLRLLHDFLDLPYAAGDGAEGHEVGTGAVGDDFCKGGLACPGRSPEDHGGNLILIQHSAQRHSFAQQVLLPDIFLYGLRTHPVCQGGIAGGKRVFALGVKKGHLFHGVLLLKCFFSLAL